jgi:hypothetical protein
MDATSINLSVVVSILCVRQFVKVCGILRGGIPIAVTGTGIYFGHLFICAIPIIWLNRQRPGSWR